MLHDILHGSLADLYYQVIVHIIAKDPLLYSTLKKEFAFLLTFLVYRIQIRRNAGVFSKLKEEKR